MLCILTHHKCASTALSAFVREFCDLNRLSLFATHVGDAVPSKSHNLSCLVNARYDVVSPEIEGAALHIVRNPFDIVVSAYHSHIRTHSLEGWPELEMQRLRLESLDLAEGFVETAHFCNNVAFYARTAGPLRALSEWNYTDSRIRTVRIEDFHDRFGDLLSLGLGEDIAAWRLPSAEKYTFTSLSGGRKRGIVDDGSHYRSGQPGEWRNVLPVEAVRLVLTACPDLLATFYPESLEHAQELLARETTKTEALADRVTIEL